LVPFSVFRHGAPIFFAEQLRGPAQITKAAFKHDIRDTVVAVFQHIGYKMQAQTVDEIGKGDAHIALDATGYDGVFLYELSFESTGTIERKRPLEPSDFAENAATLALGLAPKPVDVPYAKPGMWGRE
jgi:hypothetical protein